MTKTLNQNLFLVRMVIMLLKRKEKEHRSI